MTDIILNLPDGPAVPESREPAAVSDEEPLTLDQLRDAWNAQADAANSWDALGIDEIAWWAQKQALARWGQPATPPAVTTTALLHPAYEPGDGSADGAQMVEMERWHPVMGCDSLQVVVDNFRAGLAAPPAPAEGELVAASRPVTLATVGEEFYRNSPIARAAVRAAISEAELIRHLLENERRLTELVTDALHRAAPRTLMVHPKQEEPTEEALERVYQSAYQPAWERGEFHGAHFDGLRAVLARWGQPSALPAPAVGPVAVTERLPGPEDCAPWPKEPNASAWCWMGKETDGDWEWEQRSAGYLVAFPGDFTHWLPARALPLPSGEMEG